MKIIAYHDDIAYAYAAYMHQKTSEAENYNVRVKNPRYRKDRTYFLFLHQAYAYWVSRGENIILKKQ